MRQMIIANRLMDGRVVFMARDGSWMDSIADGVLIVDESAAQSLFEIGKRGERDCQVVDPCLIDVTERNGVRIPTVYREEIRANGPTVRTDEM